MDVRVSIHAHVRWATCWRHCLFLCRPVSIHAHVRWATLMRRLRDPEARVSIHAHVRWATRCVGYSAKSGPSFNPRPRTVGDRSYSRTHVCNGQFQSTPTYGGRLDLMALAGLREKVSIHAHVRWATGVDVDAGTCKVVSIHAHVRWATRGQFFTPYHVCVSIHAHVRWATRISLSRIGSRLSFNPRPRTVGDPQFFRARPGGRSFNPRPRTVGDGITVTMPDTKSGFQSTPTYGGRPGLPVTSCTRLLFQSTPTYGGRRRRDAKNAMTATSFNPRPRTVGDSPSFRSRLGPPLFQSTPTYGGRRAAHRAAHLPTPVSIHAHVRWATERRSHSAESGGGFNPRPRTVGDRRDAKNAMTATSFNPRPRTVGDDLRRIRPNGSGRFQSTPTYGGRRRKRRGCFGRQHVSIHAHVRWATLRRIRNRSTLCSFNPRPRTVGDEFSTPGRTLQTSFNPRPRTVGDHFSGICNEHRKQFQSTPTYGGRPVSALESRFFKKVSIHAHVRWATLSAPGGFPLQLVSIHAHVRWATHSSNGI